MGQQISQMGQGASTLAARRRFQQQQQQQQQRQQHPHDAADERRPLIHSHSSGWNGWPAVFAGTTPGGGLDPELEIDHDGCFPPHGVHEPCPANPCRDLPVYDTIHRVRKEIMDTIDDPYSLEQLRDPRMNISVVRPLVDRCYQDQDLSMIYCLLVNRAHFLKEQVAQGHQQNVCQTRALLCEMVANRVLRRFAEDNPGAHGLLLLAQILVGGFDPFQGAPPEVLEEESVHMSWRSQSRQGLKRKLPALEVAIISESKIFLSSAACQKVVNAIYEGRVVYTPSTFMDILPDHYKQKPITLYNPRKAPLLNQYRMIVPRTRNYLEVGQFIILLVLFLLVMNNRKPESLGPLEIFFSIYSFGWILDQIASILEHGWHVYTQNLWSFLDVTFSCIFFVYFALRVQGQRTSSLELGQQGLDVLAMGAPVLIPRLAFNLMSENMVFVSLRAIMRDFAVLTVLAVWCFAGFLLSMTWLADGAHETITISKWMLWVWFGLDGTGIQRSVDFHWLLGPILMVAFAFLGNTLFLTLLVSMLSNTFSTIVSNATAEIQFRRAVLTLEGVKSDAIFAYQPPFNILALVILLPIKLCVTARWFHKINVAAQRALNAPILLSISLIERRALWSGARRQKEVEPLHKSPSRVGLWDFRRGWSVHGDISRVFESASPQEEEEDDSSLTESGDELELPIHHNQPIEAVENENDNRFERAFGQASEDNTKANENGKGRGSSSPKLIRMISRQSRRDSVAPWVVNNENEVDELGTASGNLGKRLEALEKSTARIERLLVKLCDNLSDEESEYSFGRQKRETGTLKELDESALDTDD